VCVRGEAETGAPDDAVHGRPVQGVGSERGARQHDHGARDSRQGRQAYRHRAQGNQPGIQATLMDTMGTVYTSLGLYDRRRAARAGTPSGNARPCSARRASRSRRASTISARC
jgi:hypothetical protein